VFNDGRGRGTLRDVVQTEDALIAAAAADVSLDDQGRRAGTGFLFFPVVLSCWFISSVYYVLILVVP